ncbi:MAG: CerR family C-terminal domain-containing protein [Methylacidiphilales bacterium]|nr:CerR family C-terminal domain-containing protein [Candidatus Methylacidiphilales bacterium]
MVAPKSSPPRHALETREILLEAAGRIFARKGFRAATVRRITREAGVNLAAVNYHFHDKRELYTSALKHAHQAAARTAAADVAGTPEKRLLLFIQGFLGYLLDPHRPAWQGRLIAREIAEPTRALDRLVEESVLPVKKRIAGIVRDLLESRASEARVRMACCSIMGQCLFYVHCREMISRLFPEHRHKPEDIDVLAGHIFSFSQAGLAAMRRQSVAGQKKSASVRRRNTKTKKPHE